MNIVLLLLVVLCLVGIRFSGTGYFSDYLGRQQTQAIKGIFVALVFLRHYEEYIHLSGRLHKVFLLVNYYSGQLIVAMFLFYSGYGIYCAMAKKQDAYVAAMPKQKIRRLWIRFALVVLVYIGLGFAMGKHYSAKRMLAALVGWESVGNSSWYIFAILICYIATYYGYMVVKKRLEKSAANGSLSTSPASADIPKEMLLKQTIYTTMGLLFIYCLCVWNLKADAPRYYNTIFCYSAGMWYAGYREWFEKRVWKNAGTYYGSLLLEIALCAAFSVAFLKTNVMWFYMILAVVFSFMVVQITMKIKVNNLILAVLGDYVFEVYILQRIAMILFKKVSLVHERWYVFFLVCATVTAVLAWGYRKIENKYL